MGALDDAVASAAAQKSALQTAAGMKAAQEAARYTAMRARNLELTSDFLTRVRVAGIPATRICVDYREVEERNWRGKFVRRTVVVAAEYLGWTLLQGPERQSSETDMWSQSMHILETGEILVECSGALPGGIRRNPADMYGPDGMSLDGRVHGLLTPDELSGRMGAFLVEGGPVANRPPV